MKIFIMAVVFFHFVVLILDIMFDKPIESLVVHCTCLLISVVSLIGLSLKEEIKKCK